MTAERRQLQPRKRPRQARSELTRQHILEAAARVFADYGYAAGTTNRIAESADISIGSLYQYYPNKDAILLDLVTRHLDAMATAARRPTSGPPDSIEGTMRAMVRSAIDGHRDDPELLRVLIEQAPRSRELMEWIAEQEQAWVTDLQELLAENPEVCVEDKHVAVQLVIATIEFVVHPLIAAPHPIDIPSFENELVAMLTRYLTAGPFTGDAWDAETARTHWLTRLLARGRPYKHSLYQPLSGDSQRSKTTVSATHGDRRAGAVMAPPWPWWAPTSWPANSPRLAATIRRPFSDTKTRCDRGSTRSKTVPHRWASTWFPQQLQVFD